MNILEFIKSMSFRKIFKKDLRDRLSVIRQKFEEVVMPSLEDIISNEHLRKPTNKYGQTFLNDFRKQLPSNLRSTTEFEIIMRSVTNAVELCSLLEDLVSKEIPDTLYIDGITYQKATVLRVISLLDFTADYASRQLCYYISAEVKNDERPFTKAEESEIKVKQHSYFKSIALFYDTPKNIIANIAKLPEVLLDIDPNGSPAANMATQTDTLKLNFIPGVTFFFEFIGTRMADWDFERYERARKERKQIEMQIELLKQRSSGNVDARTEAIIKGYEKELTLLREKISRMEDKVRR